MSNEVQFEVRDHVAYVTINRPERRNALSLAVMSELIRLFCRAGDDSDIWAVLLTAAGDQAITWYFDAWYPDFATTAAEVTGQFLAGAFRPDEWAARIQAAADKLEQDKAVTKYHRD